MEKDLVNILTPAYNSENYISRLLDSILRQTYSKIEMFVIDDGSTDSTKEIVHEYIYKFLEKGYKLHYIYQQNSGQSYAINKGLKLLNGEFLVWPDSDDWYATTNAIKELVTALKNTDDSVGIVRCKYAHIDEITMKPIRYTKIIQKDNPGNVFNDVIYNRHHFSIEPGGYMIKLKFIDKFIPGREIYAEKDAGQNTQILYPYLFYSDCLSIDKVLFNYLIRKTSHSRNFYQGYNNKILRLDATERTYIKALQSIRQDNNPVIQNAILFSKENILHRKIALSVFYNQNKYIRELYNTIKKEYGKKHLTTNEKILYLLSYIPLGIIFYKLLQHIRR